MNIAIFLRTAFLIEHLRWLLLIEHLKWLLNSSSVMRCAVWYHLYNLKNMKNTHGGVLLLVKLLKACNFTKSNTPPWVFSRFLNCINGTKSRKTSLLIWGNVYFSDVLFIVS